MAGVEMTGGGGGAGTATTAGGGGGAGTATTTGGASGAAWLGAWVGGATLSRRAGHASAGRTGGVLRTSEAVGAGAAAVGAGAGAPDAGTAASVAEGVAGRDASRRSGTGGTFSATTACSRGR